MFDLLPEDDAAAGAAIYTPRLLAIYDLLVLGFSSRCIWKCPSGRVLELYNHHVTGNHLDVGVGTGYFLDRCRFPATSPRIGLLDLNANSLAYAARRLARYRPETYLRNVLNPITIDAPPFDSIAINFVLHCLPGRMDHKAAAFDNLLPLLNPGGVLFGTTILGEGATHGLMARALMPLYNRRRIFSNLSDRPNDLNAALQQRFARHEEFIVGSVEFFAAKKRAAG